MKKKASASAHDAAVPGVVEAPGPDSEAVESAPLPGAVDEADSPGPTEDVAPESLESEGMPARFKALAHSRTFQIVAGLAVVLVLGGGIGLKVYSDSVRAAEAAAVAKAAAQARSEKAAVASFDKFIGHRATILAAEATLNDSVSKAQQSVKEYKAALKARASKVKKLDAEYEKEYERVRQHNELEDAKRYGYYYYSPSYWDYPDSPTEPDYIKVPSFTSLAEALREADGKLRSASALLEADKEDAALTEAVARLREAAASLSGDMLHDADVLLTCVEPSSEDDPGSIDAKQLATLRTSGAGPVLALVNDAITKFITDHKLDVRLYDVPGGRDISASDSSTRGSIAETPSAETTPVVP